MSSLPRIRKPTNDIDLVDFLLLYALRLHTCEPGKFPALMAFTGSPEERIATLAQRIRQYLDPLRALWNRLELNAKGAPTWDGSTIPQCLNVSLWHASPEYEVRRGELIDLLVSMRCLIRPPLWPTGAGKGPAAGVAVVDPIRVAWDDLSRIEQAIVAAVRSEPLLGKHVASKLTPQRELNSISKPLAQLVERGILRNQGRGIGYSLRATVLGAPWETNGRPAE